VDLRPETQRHPEYLDPDSYQACQALGSVAIDDGLPGFLTYAVRDRNNDGWVAAVFDENLLERPEADCSLTYLLHPAGGKTTVQDSSGKEVLEVEP
jgi:hypothetical protein